MKSLSIRRFVHDGPLLLRFPSPLPFTEKEGYKNPELLLDLFKKKSVRVRD